MSRIGKLPINIPNGVSVSITGQEVMQQNGISNRAQLDLSNLSEGVYFVVVRTQKGVVSSKVLKF